MAINSRRFWRLMALGATAFMPVALLPACAGDSTGEELTSPTTSPDEVTTTERTTSTTEAPDVPLSEVECGTALSERVRQEMERFDQATSPSQVEVADPSIALDLGQMLNRNQAAYFGQVVSVTETDQGLVGVVEVYRMFSNFAPDYLAGQAQTPRISVLLDGVVENGSVTWPGGTGPVRPGNLIITIGSYQNGTDTSQQADLTPADGVGDMNEGEPWMIARGNFVPEPAFGWILVAETTPVPTPPFQDLMATPTRGVTAPGGLGDAARAAGNVARTFRVFSDLNAGPEVELQSAQRAVSPKVPGTSCDRTQPYLDPFGQGIGLAMTSKTG